MNVPPDRPERADAFTVARRTVLFGLSFSACAGLVELAGDGDAWSLGSVAGAMSAAVLLTITIELAIGSADGLETSDGSPNYAVRLAATLGLWVTAAVTGTLAGLDHWAWSLGPLWAAFFAVLVYDGIVWLLRKRRERPLNPRRTP